MLPDSSAILNAVSAKLGADTELLTLVPNGVYEDVAPPGAQRFVIVSQILATDTPVFHSKRVMEDHLLLVEARVLTTTRGNASAAAARVDALLEDGTLDVPGYRLRAMFREEFVRGTEVDEVDPAIKWKRRGGRYRVQVYRQILASAIAAEEVFETTADRFGLIDIAIWFDGPLTIPDGSNVGVTVQSSDPLRRGDALLTLSLPLSDLDVTDPAAPGRASLRWRSAFDMSTLAGLTFTLSNASPRTNWAQILNRETGEPVVDSLGAVILVIPVLAL